MAADVGTLTERAKELAALHRGERPLLLPNAWDAASAQVLEGAGFPAIATSSSAVAGSLGYPDGEAAPAAEMLAAVARIAAVSSVPVTADLEAGYGLPPVEIVERLLEVRAVADVAGVGLVINARVDVYLHQVGTPGQRLAEALRRARQYLEAGADCVFPILVSDEESIAELVRDAGGPVNVLYQPGTPSLRRLAELGVARVSFGGGLHRATEALLQRLAERILAGEDPYRR